MQERNAERKPTYESPILVPLGALAKGLGYCAAGSGAVDGYCEDGASAAAYCTAGISAGTACTAGGVASTAACTDGGAAPADCTAGSHFQQPV